MLAYRSEAEPIDPAAAWRALVDRADALTGRPGHDEVTTLLIDVGETESAVADWLFPHRDGSNALGAALRRASLATAGLFVASWRAAPDLPRRLEDARDALRRIDSRLLPPVADRRVSEGYAYYALHPETYARAAERFAAAVRPRQAVVVGIRSIGTSLSATVGAALSADGIPVELESVRPRGHPFDRELSLDDDLRERLGAHVAAAHFLIVDEGPGLSGSSFTCTATALSALGVPPGRVAFFPSWDADGSSFNSGRARDRWRQHARWIADAEDAGVGIGAVTAGDTFAEWSAGEWRGTLLPGSTWPAVNPRHERVKRFLPDRGEVVRFAGLGRYGAERLDRAAALASAGYGAHPIALESGYLRLPFAAGAPLAGCSDGARAEVVRFAARYLAHLVRAFPVDRPADVEGLHHMMRTNLGAADPAIAVAPLERFGAALLDSRATALDGRMLLHEFIRGPRGLVKVDTLDHASDHFYPGPQDIAWDLAALEAELGLDGAGSAALLDAYGRQSGDAHPERRMPFYRLAYAAFQIGYGTLSHQSLAGSPDAERFARRAAAFTERARALASVPPRAGRSQ